MININRIYKKISTHKPQWWVFLLVIPFSMVLALIGQTLANGFPPEKIGVLIGFSSLLGATKAYQVAKKKRERKLILRGLIASIIVFSLIGIFSLFCL